MKQVKTLLISAMMMTAGQAMAQTTEGELVDVLPDGVTANVNPERKQDKQKNIVIAGSPQKGYKAFFAATDADHGEKVWLQYGNWRPGTLSNWVKEQVVAGGSMYWWNEENIVESGYATSLYRLDAWDAEPVVCTHIDMQKGDLVNTLRNMGGTIVFASDATKRVYAYKYTKPGWDGKSDMGYLEPDFLTDAEKTAIQEVKSAQQEPVDATFDLQGRRVNDNARGLFIRGGKKLIVK